MKLILSRISEGEEEVIIRYREMNEKIGTIISFLQGTGQKISAEFEGQTALLEPEKSFIWKVWTGMSLPIWRTRCAGCPQVWKRFPCAEERGLFSMRQVHGHQYIQDPLSEKRAGEPDTGNYG